MSENRLVVSAGKVDSAVRTQCSQHLTMQNFFMSVKQQSDVDLSHFPDLQKIGADLNDGLTTARSHASLYLDTISPNIITNIANIENYYTLHQAVATTLPPGSSKKQWVKMLSTLRDQSIDFKNHAGQVTTSLQTLRDDLSADVKAFSQIVSDLNAAVGGDKGVLANVSKQLDDLQSRIDGANAALALSGLAVLAGVFLILVGAIAGFVTAGTSSVLVLGGVAIVLAGTSAGVASVVVLKGLHAEQAKLLQDRTTLKSEVALATGISSSYNTLSLKAQAAAAAALDMQSAWEFLGSDLDSLAKDVDNGIVNTDDVRTMFLSASNSMINSVQRDASTIRQQMTGATPLDAPAGTTIGDFAVSVAEKHAA